MFLLFHDFLGFYIDVPSYNFEKKYYSFSFKSLMTMPEVFNAISRVKADCNKVSSMILFQTPISKSMKLEEYEQVQSQTTSHVGFC